MSGPSWFDPRGRLSRRAYGWLFVRLSLVTTGLLCLAIRLAAQGWRAAALAVAALILVAGIAGLAASLARLHDRGRTGWWLALSLVLAALGQLPLETAADAYPVAVSAFALGSRGFSAWFIVETLGRPGTMGTNRYGPAPPE